MSTALIRELVKAKTGEVPPMRSDALKTFSVVASHPAIAMYLASCVSDQNYTASVMGVAGYSRLVEENLEYAGPGCFVYRHGFLVIASSIGGNVIAGDSGTGDAYWLEHSQFTEDFIMYNDAETGELRDFDVYSADHIRIAGKRLGTFEDVVRALLVDGLASFVEQHG